MFRDPSQVVGHTPRDTPVPFYTRTSPSPNKGPNISGNFRAFFGREFVAQSWVHASGVVQQHSVLRRVLRRFWEGFWGRVLRRVLSRGVCYGFYTKKGSEKCSQKGF